MNSLLPSTARFRRLPRHTSRWPLGATTLWPAPLAGRAFRRDPLAFLLRQEECDGVSRFKVGFSDFVLINRPELVQRVLVGESGAFGEGKWTQRGYYTMGDCLITREGAPHRARRALLRSSFALSRIQAGGPAMVACAQRLAERWEDGRSVDIREEMAHVALTAATSTLFSEDLESEADDIVAALREMLGSISRLPLPRPRLTAARRLLRETVLRFKGGHLVEGLRAAGLSEQEVCDEIVSLLMATVDTTPSTLAWTWFALGRHLGVEERLHDELSQILGGCPPTADDIPRLRYQKLVLTEVLRLYPPVHFIDRRALEDVDLGGVTLRKGEYILLCPLLTHRDARYHEDPLRFWPERWEPERAKSQRSYSYFPFGGGPHVCIGMGLAEQELALILGTLAQQWRLRPAESLPRDPSPQTARFRMRLEKRG